MNKEPEITLVVITRNSGERLKKLIDKHRDLVKEVIVVDQSSTDNTFQIAKENADWVFKRTCKSTQDPDRNWAFNLAETEWVLSLDDDELLSDRLVNNLKNFLIEQNVDVVCFRRLNIVDNVDISPIMGDDYQCRLFKKGTVMFPDAINTYPEIHPNAKVAYVSSPIIHLRTLEGLKNANKAREKVASPEAIETQNQFIKAVELYLEKHNEFDQEWYSDEQIKQLVPLVIKAKRLDGSVIEIGSWEGKSTIAIANAAYPENVIAIDTWKGNLSEEDHPTVAIAQGKDVFKSFKKNIEKNTKGNVEPIQTDCHVWEENYDKPIKFVHIDAAHDYDSVKKTIENLKDKVVKGGIMCGDDIKSAHMGREDLKGGVERAVKELLPEYKQIENFWYWIKE